MRILRMTEQFSTSQAEDSEKFERKTIYNIKEHKALTCWTDVQTQGLSGIRVGAGGEI